MMRSLLLLLLGLSALADAAPRIKTIPLERHTTLTLNIDQGGGGTRFVFPFALDRDDDNIPFTLTMTNPAFADTYSATKLPDRNSFVVTLPPSRDGSSVGSQRANLFLTVAGYEVTIELHSTNDPGTVYSDVVFELADAAREQLIQQAVRQRTQVLEREYQDKRAGLDADADRLALGKIGALAMNEPRVTRIKEEQKLPFVSGEAVLFVDRAVSYGPYTIVRFDVDNHGYGAPLVLQGAKLFGVKADVAGGSQVVPLEGGVTMPETVNPRDTAHGALTVLTAAIPTATKSLRLQVATDKGNIQVEW